MAEFDSADLLGKVKARGLVPGGQTTYSDSDILGFATDEMRTELLPILIEAMGEFLVATKDHTIAAGTASYVISHRAAFNVLRSVHVVGTDGRITALEERSAKEVGEQRLSTAQGKPMFYVAEAGYITLYPTPSTSGDILRTKHFVRPGLIVPVTTGYTTVTTKPLTNQVTCPANLSGSIAANAVMDIIRAKNPFDLLNFEIVVSTISGTGPYTVTFATDYNTDLAVGDQLCISGNAGVPQIPAELHVPLALRTAAVLHRGFSNNKQADSLLNDAIAKEKKAIAALSPRTKSKSHDISNYVW